MLKKKFSLGRQKIPIEKIPKKSHLQVTFSKRRSGLFKKASELCTLCGVEIAIVVFSPANKAFSFGHPEVESIIDRYLSRNPPQESSSHQLVEAHRNANVRDLNVQLTQLLSHLEIEKKQGEEIDHVRKARQMQFWWESPVDELGLNELLQLKVSIEDLRKNLGKIASKCMMEQSNVSSSNIGANGFLGVGINIASPLPNSYYLGFRI
ncbi:putative transcription factor MADS-type1 family [Medicago truncatula]|uniref:MADS-box transcription factor family protein n=1 Tax=Medicago truncatula TaxID=3880 RepID=G7J813_MEDTR|nr:agamous-like MADS-box protein AGL61 [Medicago truncatula]AES71710.1 MADS-box transcription factor family protein [Medicago truncatula]RHN68986.1 putative transcription factor MADS-type1 family [Medicago truncatula]